MSTSSNENSQTSESASEGRQNSPTTITSVRKRSIFKDKQEEEEAVAAEKKDPSPTGEKKDAKFTFLGTQETLKNVVKVFPALAISLLILSLVYWFVRSARLGNSISRSREKRVFHVEFSGEKANEFESAVWKLRDQVEAFGEATRLMQEKLDLLEGKLERMDLDNSAARATMGNLELQLSEFNQSLSDLKNLFRNDPNEPRNETLQPEIFTEILDFTRMVIEEEIEKHEADGIGKLDYALASGGAVILGHSEPGFPVNEHRHLIHPDAIKMLQPSFGESGQCFSLNGSSGYVDIRLRTEIVPKSFSLEHVSHRVAYDLSSAPKACIVTGWLERNFSANAAGGNETIEVHKLANFTYDLEKKKNLQTFEVEERSNCSEGSVVNVVRFEFTSNYGADCTCIYRFRVHGHEANGTFRKSANDQSSATNESVQKSILLLAMLVFIAI